MQVLDRTGVGTLWSICKTKFALAGHTHNSLAAVGNEQINATAYGSGLHFKPYYSSGGPTTYGNILEYTSTNTGGGQLAMEWTGGQIKNDGTDSNVGRVYYRSKRDCIDGWTKWMTLAYTNDIPTKLSQLTNDKGFVTGSVSGNTITINGASTTWTNTWRGIQDNLTSTSTSESLSANQGRILKSLIDGKANSSHTHSWSQISGTPATATRWPSWGEVTGKPGSFTPSSHTHDWSQVTGKPELKNWSDTKSYIDNKTASSGCVDSLPIGTELMSYNGSNIFGDKFVKEDGKYYKRSETSFDFGPIKSISPNRKYIETTTEEGSTVLIYFNGYYYTEKYNKWCKSQTIDGQFSEAPELKNYSNYDYIGNGAFCSYFDKKVIILGGTQYSLPDEISIEYYKDGYFLTYYGITKNFKTYINPAHGTFRLCENEGYFWVEDSTNYYLCIYDYTGKLLAKSKYSYNDHLGSFRNVAYCKATNTAYVSTYVNSTYYEGVIYFNKNTSKMKECLGNVYRNIFGSIVISAVEDSEEFTVSDCYENFPTYNFSTKGLHPSYKLQIFSISILNGVTYVRCRYHNTYYDNYDCRHLIEITGLYSNDIYCQAKNSPSTFVKVK